MLSTGYFESLNLPNNDRDLHTFDCCILRLRWRQFCPQILQWTSMRCCQTFFLQSSGHKPLHRPGPWQKNVTIMNYSWANIVSHGSGPFAFWVLKDGLTKKNGVISLKINIICCTEFKALWTTFFQSYFYLKWVLLGNQKSYNDLCFVEYLTICSGGSPTTKIWGSLVWGPHV